MMLDATKDYLNQLVINLHNQARLENRTDLRKIADDISDVLKKEQEACYM